MLKKQIKSFSYAFKGIFNCILNEGHFRFDLVAAAYVIFFAVKFYSLSKTEWIAVIFTICTVLLCEAFNTAIEGICDKITSDYDEKIKYIKDTSAGAVLISAILAVSVAAFLLFDISVFISIFNYYISHILNLVLLLISAVLAVIFIIFDPRKNEKESEK